MKSRLLASRYHLLGAILLCYLVPLGALLAFHSFGSSPYHYWISLSSALFLVSCGSLALYLFVQYWELAWQERQKQAPLLSEIVDESKVEPIGAALDPEEFKFNKLALAEAQQTQVRLLDEVDILNEELKKITEAAERDRQEAEQANVSALQQLEQQQRHVRELYEAVAEQKALVDMKQQQIVHLETKVSDLTNEIKTLLQLAEGHNKSMFKEESGEAIATMPIAGDIATNSVSASLFPNPLQQLKRCLEIAQRITGSHRFGSQLYSFLDSPAESFALDLRRLCDRLRAEQGETIVLFSPGQGQVLFVSHQVKDLSGWSPEKFILNFAEIMEGGALWNQGVAALATRNEVQLLLPMRLRSGETQQIQASMGIIPTGIFRNQVIAILAAVGNNEPLAGLTTSTF